MGRGHPLHDAEQVHGYVRRVCFKTGPPGRVGAELEWLVAPRDDPAAVVPIPLLRSVLAAADAFPGDSLVTLEPGGQVELSSAVAADVTACCAALAVDVAHLEAVLSGSGLVLVPGGVDPRRRPVRQLHERRYDAMAAYFDTLPHELGPVMMTSTAAVQVNLDAGADAADVARRWRLLHLVGPTLSAAFANSPLRQGRSTGWKSTRQAVWLELDPPRTHPPAVADPCAAWTDYALAAPVMMLRTETGPWVAAPGFSFGAWVAGDVNGLGRPTEDDLAYHLTTLFPPVRPRGWLEVRYLDAQATPWWPVPVVVLATLLELPELADTVAAACSPVSDSWLRAARHGLDDDQLARAARSVFEAVLDRVDDAALRATVLAFTERYVARSRCPADDLLDGHGLTTMPFLERELR